MDNNTQKTPQLEQITQPPENLPQFSYPPPQEMPRANKQITLTQYTKRTRGQEDSTNHMPMLKLANTEIATTPNPRHPSTGYHTSTARNQKTQEPHKCSRRKEALHKNHKHRRATLQQTPPGRRNGTHSAWAPSAMCP